MARALWKFRWTLVCNLFLVSPILFYEMQLGGGWGDKIVLFALPASLLWLALLQLVARGQARAHAALLPFYLVAATDLWMIRHHHSRLTSSMLLVMLENSSDTGPFIRANASALVAGLLALLVPWALAVRAFAAQRLQLQAPRWAVPACIGALIALYGGLTLRQSGGRGGSLRVGLLDTLSHDRNSPFGIIPQAFTAWQLRRQNLEESQRAASFSFGARRAEAISGREVYLLVVGESARPDHWGVYGYRRQTTPRLAAEPGVIVFRDVVSQAALTQISVPLLITRSDITRMASFPPEKSIVSAYREAGFRTFWLSTQQRDQWTGPLNRFPPEAAVQGYFERQHDDVLVEAVRTALREPGAEKFFFVLHTQGGHFVFSDRFPPGFGVFKGGSAIDDYDDSVRFTDHVLGSLIEMLREENAISALLYVGDHGENLRDDDRQLWGHFINNEYDLPVPMALWVSVQFAARFPAKLAAARSNAGRPLSTSVVFHTLADLGNLLVDRDQQTRSVLSQALIAGPRMVLHDGKTIDFDRSGLAGRRVPVR
jgi:glucan phosphoethanolaminetransferase (alkaline phosphatase superfamily)